MLGTMGRTARRAATGRSLRAGAAALVVIAMLGADLATTGGVAHADPGGVVISEMNYHAGSDLDTDDFIELANTAATDIDMSGWSFTAGVTGVLPTGSIIPAGGWFVVAKDATQFQALHGFAPDAVYGGNLSNSGETVTIVDASLTPVDSVTYADSAPWPVAADGTGPSLELRGLSYDNTLAESWGASLVSGGTPGAVNSINGTPPSPLATAVTATPHQPDPGQAVAVTARLPIGATATMSYKIMFAADVVVPFLDDAASPGGAGDGVFAATIPGQAAGQLIRYRIDARSTAGVAFSSPIAGDSIQYQGVVVKNPAVTTNLPLIEWFMSDAVYNDLLANHRHDDVAGAAVIAYNGTVFDGATMAVRGQSSRDLPKVNWKVDMPKGYELDMRPLMPYPLDEWALQRDPDPLADLAWQTVRDAGGRSLGITAVRSQRNGEFWGVGRAMETEDGTWRDAQGVSNRSIYKGDAGGLERTASPAALEASLDLEKRSRKDEDFSDAWNLTQNVDAPASAAQKEWLYQNVNIPELINYMAINTVLRHQDSNWKNWFVARDTEGTSRWEMWHWDLNWLLRTPAEDQHGEYLLPVTDNHLLIALMNYPEFKDMFYRRLRTLADVFLAPNRFEAQWDAIVNPYLSDWALETAKWGGDSATDARLGLLAGLTDRRNVIANNTGPGKPIPPPQTAAPNVVIDEIQYNPVQGQNAEFVELANPSATESVDLSGWTIDGLGLTIAPGTVILPNARLVFVKNDATFRQVYGPGSRLVGGEYPGTLNDAGGTLRLMQGTRVADEVTYSPTAPWPTAANGTGPSLELADLFMDNAQPASWTATAPAGGTPGQANTVVLPLDVTVPSAPQALASSAIGPAQATLSWNAATDDRGVAGYQLVRNGVAQPGLIPGLTVTDTGLSPSTTYTYTVRAVDGTGNVGPASNAVPVTTGAPDPLLYADQFTGADGSLWGPAWSTSISNGTATQQSGTGQLAFTNTSGAFSRAQLSGIAARTSSDTVFSYQFNAANASAYFNVYTRGSGGWQNEYRPRNGYGLEIAANSGSIGVIRTVNGTVSTLRTVSGARQVSTAKQWLRLRVDGTTVQFRTWVDGQTEPTTWSATLTDSGVTAPGQLYLSLVRGSSNTGLKNVQIDNVRVIDTATPTGDVTAPSTPTGLSSSGVTQTQATLSWNAATDNVGVTGYQITRNGVVLPTSVSGTTFTDTGLTAGTTYTYSVRAFDAAGNFSGSSTTTSVMTPQVQDTTSPSAPGTLTASGVTANQVTLSWGAATDNRGVTGYRVVRNGTVLPTPVTGLTYTDTGLTAATAYTYTVRAFDAGGNVGADSNSVAVTTSATSPFLFSDAFARADGAAWGTGWTTSVGSGGTATLVGGTGQLALTNTSGSYSRSLLSGLAARTNSDTLFSYKFSAATASAYFSVYTRGSGGWQNEYRPRSGYGLEFSASSGSVTVIRNANGTVTELRTVSGARQVSTTKQWVRLRVSGQTVQFRTWVDGQAEPSTWNATLTDASVTAAGQLHFSLVRGSSNTGVKNVQIDDVQVADAP